MMDPQAKEQEKHQRIRQIQSTLHQWSLDIIKRYGHTGYFYDMSTDASPYRLYLSYSSPCFCECDQTSAKPHEIESILRWTEDKLKQTGWSDVQFKGFALEEELQA